MIVGIDEVGRGCWAGPLVAGAVILTKPLSGLRDSKKLSKLQRQKMDLLIREHAIFGLGWVWPDEIDNEGLTAAVQLAMERALQQVAVEYEQVIVDGNYNFLKHLPNTTALVRADDQIPAVSAASIIAKVARDTYMQSLKDELPGYGFENHVGYGTRQHAQALRQLGLTSHHRRSFAPIEMYKAS